MSVLTAGLIPHTPRPSGAPGPFLARNMGRTPQRKAKTRAFFEKDDRGRATDSIPSRCGLGHGGFRPGFFLCKPVITCLETGLVRAKNSINVALKNISDVVLCTVGYWLFGFGLMFGSSAFGLVGTDSFMLLGHADPAGYAYFVFQAVFAGTAVTVVSGAMAERVKFNAYLIAAVVIGGIIYPVFGHWAWGDGLLGGSDGWLGRLHFVDFAGSSVVHSIGGWVGLAGAILLGPRLGRF